MKKVEVENQIKELTKIFIRKSLAISYNFPKETIDGDLVWENYKNLAFTLKEEPYETMYKECLDNKDFNFLMLDGALVQMKYKFYKKNIISHILAFYPNPDIESYQENPEEFESIHYDSIKLFTDNIDKNIVTFPIRFDYDDNSWTDCEHPKVHATLGNIKNCRIPMSHPISPNRFILFILRNFYFEKFKESFSEDIKTALEKRLTEVNLRGKLKSEIEKTTLQIENELLNKIFCCKIGIAETISPNERNLIHFSFYK